MTFEYKTSTKTGAWTMITELQSVIEYFESRKIPCFHRPADEGERKHGVYLLPYLSKDLPMPKSPLDLLSGIYPAPRVPETAPDSTSNWGNRQELQLPSQRGGKRRLALKPFLERKDVPCWTRLWRLSGRKQRIEFLSKTGT
jgi:hypothetical protein